MLLQKIGKFLSMALLMALLFAAGCGRDAAGPDQQSNISQGNTILAASAMEEVGNNLSFPVIWSDGVTKPLRGDPNSVLFEGASTDLIDPETGQMVTWYHQQDSLNTWQAESADWSASPFHVSRIDWGDNLEAKDWSITSVVRTEVVLFRDLGDYMKGFEMSHIADQGPDEMWGTNTLRTESYEATVYSGCARLTIQKLAGDPNDPDNPLDLAWDAESGKWVGDVGRTLANGGVWESDEGQSTTDKYSGEINVSGKLIYGYNWNLKRNNDGPGYYRITFSLDGLSGSGHPNIALNTHFWEGYTTIMLPAEVVAAAGINTDRLKDDSGSSGSDEGGGVAVIDFNHNLTFIDVHILQASGGKK
ncbi:MAG: hypothetical protein AB1746_05275 [Candidatus Zixiibacteriota bacterium]